MNHINKKTVEILESINDLGVDLKERSKNEFDHAFIDSSVDDINRALCVLVELAD